MSRIREGKNEMSVERIFREDVRKTPKCIEGREYFKPFDYPKMFQIAMEHEQIHWVPTEISLADDVVDWEYNLTEDEKNLLMNLFRFFTQADVGVLQGYAGKFLPLFWKTPEIAAACGSIAAREMVHVWGYSLLLETIGMDEGEYKAFLDIEAMYEKEDFVNSFNCDTPEDTAKTLAVYGAFVEGIQLFSSFAILMNFPRFNKMKGMGKVVEWSIRDEAKHVEFCVEMYHIWLKENPQINREKLEQEIVEICQKMVYLEDEFIDLVFASCSDINGLDPEDVKKYIRSIADYRLTQLGLNKIYNVENPLAEWLDPLIYGSRHTSFFENRVTEYARGSIEFNELDEDNDW